MLTRGKKNKAPYCIKCNVNLDKRTGAIKIVKTMAEAKKLTAVMRHTTIVKGDKICKKCTTKYLSVSSDKENEEKSNLRQQKQSKTQTYEEFSWGEESSPSDDSSDDPDFQLDDNDDPDLSSDSDSEVRPAKVAKFDVAFEPFQHVKADLDSCFICKLKTDLIEVPLSACQQVTVEARLFLPSEIKCCKIHLQNDSFSKEVIDKINIQQRNLEGSKTELS